MHRPASFGVEPPETVDLLGSTQRTTPVPMPPAPSPENRAPTRARQPIRSNIGGILVIIASPILAVTVAIWYVSLDLYYVALTVVGAAFIAVGGIVGIEIGRRLRAVDARELMRRDTRPPIVLIRPPKEDRRIVHGAPVGNIEGGTERTSRRAGSRTRSRSSICSASWARSSPREPPGTAWRQRGRRDSTWARMRRSRS